MIYLRGLPKGRFPELRKTVFAHNRPKRRVGYTPVGSGRRFPLGGVHHRNDMRAVRLLDACRALLVEFVSVNSLPLVGFDQEHRVSCGGLDNDFATRNVGDL